jgi:hypothetical protein
VPLYLLDQRERLLEASTFRAKLSTDVSAGHQLAARRRHAGTMPSRRPIDTAAIDDLLRRAERVVTHAQLQEVGLSLSTICSRILRTGAWQRLHPGVVLAHSGQATRREWMLGALAYAGPGSQLTGLAGARMYGVRAVGRVDLLHVLIPHERRRQGRAGLTIERTRQLPEPRQRAGLSVAPPARCAVDACRELTRLADVRELIAEVVQSRICSVDELTTALAQAARQRTALPREVLREVSDGVRSAAEAHVREVFDRYGIRQPRWNWSLHTRDGRHLVTPDGYWEDIGCALQVDSMAWHLSPALYKRTQRLQRLLGQYGVPFLPVAPGDVFADEAAFARQVQAFLSRHADHQPSIDLVARPPRP